MPWDLRYIEVGIEVECKKCGYKFEFAHSSCEEKSTEARCPSCNRKHRLDVSVDVVAVEEWTVTSRDLEAQVEEERKDGSGSV